MAQDEVLEVLKKHPNGMSRVQLIRDHGFTRTAATKGLKALRKWGLIEALADECPIQWRAIPDQEIQLCISCNREMYKGPAMCGICRKANGRMN